MDCGDVVRDQAVVSLAVLEEDVRGIAHVAVMTRHRAKETEGVRGPGSATGASLLGAAVSASSSTRTATHRNSIRMQSVGGRR